jgi:hypothetical protein
MKISKFTAILILFVAIMNPILTWQANVKRRKAIERMHTQLIEVSQLSFTNGWLLGSQFSFFNDSISWEKQLEKDSINFAKRFE